MTRLRIVTESQAQANARPLTTAILTVAPRAAIRAVPCTEHGCNCPPGEHHRTCDRHRRTIEPRRSAA